MKIKYMSSASVLIQDEDSSILTDPWFIDGEFYGSWHNYPPCTIKFDELVQFWVIEINGNKRNIKSRFFILQN